MAAEHNDSRDERIGRVLNEYLDRALQGQPIGEAELLEAHPDLADDLRAHFGMVRQVGRSALHGSASGGALSSLGRNQAAESFPPPDALPGYEIQGEIHRGGQGVVYQALQKATRRKVAIKVMREGPFAGWRDRARFEREVQILAGLRHPGVVTIHDSGIASGCHYFVMDYVAGSPLDQWCSGVPPYRPFTAETAGTEAGRHDARESGAAEYSGARVILRPIEQILRLFSKVCDAVNQAHLKGIIHRDLKPGNIRIDAEDNPHILDFGLAKVAAGDGEQGEEAGMTVIGQFVGSLPWTSPEQAQGMLEHVDTRTDVYALGVILYQMLTGRFPYDVVGPMRDVLNRIVSDEPVRPSTLRKDIGRDLEAIVLKCLHKEPHRRYQTAGELGRDIERYLDGEPVAALAGSGLYVVGKTLRRHRAAVAVAASFALLVAVSLLGSFSLWRQAAAERDRAVAAQREQVRERERADAKAAEAGQAREVAERERVRAQEQAEQLRRTSYLNRIALARSANEEQYLTRAQQLLEACPADLRGWEWHYLLALSTRPTLLDIQADPERVLAMAICPDSQRLATGGRDGAIRIWDGTSGSAISELHGHTDQVNALAFSPDGRWIASAGRDKTLRLWDTRANPELHTVDGGSQKVLQEGEQYLNSVSFSPDGTCVVAGGAGRVLTFWDVNSGQIILSTPAQEKEISCLAFSPDGRLVASGELLNPPAGGGRILIWDAATGQRMRELAGPPGAVLSVAFSPDGRALAAGGGTSPAGQNAHGTLKIFDAGTWEERLSLRGHEGFVDAVAFSPDGRLLASAGVPRTPAFGMESDHTVKIWDAQTGAELSIYSAHERGGRSVAWSRDAGRVFSAGMDGRLKAWPSSTPPEARVLRGHAGSVRRIAFSPDGKRIASGGAQREGEAAWAPFGPPEDGETSGGIVRVWDLETGSPLLGLAEHKNTILGLAWSPDGRYIASGGADRAVRVWDSATGARQLLLPSPEGVVHSVAFSPDSTLLAAVRGYTATLWSIPDGQEYRQLRHRDTPLAVTFSPDGERIATSVARGEIKIWDRESGREHRSITTGPGLNGAWFSPHSRTIASAHTNGTIVLWDVSTGEQVASMYGPQRSVEWIDFSPDGLRLASGTTDMMLKVWDVPSASEVYSVRAHDAPVMCVRFSPDGGAIATCGQDGLIKLWEARPD